MVYLFISILNMYHTFALSDVIGLIIFVKYFKTYLNTRNTFIHRLMNMKVPTRQSFQSVAQAGVCSQLYSCDLKAQE